MEIVAHDGRGDPETSDQDVGHESLGTEGRETSVERAHDHPVDRAEPRQREGLGGGGRQAEDLGRAGEVVARMRLEGENRAGSAHVPRQFVGPRHDGLVPTMDPVEIADRHHGAF